jgi:triphosphoribosyl-dephospho-CoA synthase
MVLPVGETLADSGLRGDPMSTRVQLACLLEAAAPKPGNVSPGHDFADMTYGDLVRSALALGPVFTSDRVRSSGVGELIGDGVRATASVTRANTNLGIVLLFAPLARAAVTRVQGESLREAAERTLARLTTRDAALAFEAIVRAAPGGLGDAPDHDVRAPARVTLRDAMAAAAHRDLIASEYASGYAVVFDEGLPLLTAALDAGVATLDAIVAVHVGLLAAHPDTLIARKAGAEQASAVMAAAREVRAGARTLADLDARLRTDGHRLNPGATADLVAATLLAALVTEVPLP